MKQWCFSPVLIFTLGGVFTFYPVRSSRVIAGDAPAAPVAAYSAKVDQNSGVVITSNSSLRTLPPIKVESAADIDRTYVAPPSANHDYYRNSSFGENTLSDGMLSISVLDAENMALAHSWKLRAAVTGRDVARGKKYNAIGGLLPSFGYSANYQIGQSAPDNLHYTPAERSAFAQSPGFTQPLFHGGALIADLREAYLNIDKVEQDIRYQRLSVRADIRKMYYSCLYAKKRADVYRKQMDIASEYWKKTEQRYEAEDVPEIDVLKYRVNYQLSKSQYITARNDYNTGVTQLLRYLGQPLKSEVFLNDAFDFTDFDPGDANELTTYALANRPDLKSSELNEQMLKQEVRKAKAGLLPTVDGQVNFTQGTNYSQQSERYVGNWGWAAGVQLNWNALAGMGQQLRGKIIQANAALEQAEYGTKDISDGIKQDVRNAIFGILSSIESVKAQQENVEQANRVLTQENMRWGEGASDYLNILDAQNSVTNAELAYWNGIYNYKTSVVDLEYTLGKFYQSANDEVKSARAIKPNANFQGGENDALSMLATPAKIKKSGTPTLEKITIVGENAGMPEWNESTIAAPVAAKNEIANAGKSSPSPIKTVKIDMENSPDNLEAFAPPKPLTPLAPFAAPIEVTAAKTTEISHPEQNVKQPAPPKISKIEPANSWNEQTVIEREKKNPNRAINHARLNAKTQRKNSAVIDHLPTSAVPPTVVVPDSREIRRYNDLPSPELE